MFKGNCRWVNQAIVSCLLLLFCSWGLIGCGERIETTVPPEPEPEENLVEVAPPLVIQQLGSSLDSYQPQVAILNPQTDQVIEDTKVEVKLEVRDLPTFKDEELGLGPHLNVLLDNQPYSKVYNLENSLILEDLAPGTHTLRVFASLPWDESFKNEGAYAQTTFHIFTKTQSNNPDPLQPLLTYGNPQGSYGAEPILLDFYLNNAPLHLVAQENSVDEISDWLVRVTINGQSFLLDSWEPVYLEGFEPGKNWIRLELLDETGNLIDNEFNDTVRLITYEPGGQDSLSKIVRGEFSLAQVRGIVDPDYIYEEEITTPEIPSVLPQEEEVTEPEIIEEALESQEEEIVTEQTEKEEEVVEDSGEEATLEEEATPTEEIEMSDEEEATFNEEIETTLEEEVITSEEEVITSQEIEVSDEEEATFNEEVTSTEEIEVSDEERATSEEEVETTLEEDVITSQQVNISDDEEIDVPESEFLELEETELLPEFAAES